MELFEKVFDFIFYKLSWGIGLFIVISIIFGGFCFLLEKMFDWFDHREWEWCKWGIDKPFLNQTLITDILTDKNKKDLVKEWYQKEKERRENASPKA